MGAIEQLYERYHDRANFLLVYTREEHPTDGGHKPAAWTRAPVLKDACSLEERAQAARQLRQLYHLQIPILVDDMQDTVSTAYNGRPSRLFVLDSGGCFAHVGALGPAGFDPKEAAPALDKLLPPLPKSTLASAAE
jgi:hypothetical protein